MRSNNGHVRYRFVVIAGIWVLFLAIGNSLVNTLWAPNHDTLFPHWYKGLAMAQGDNVNPWTEICGHCGFHGFAYVQAVFGQLFGFNDFIMFLPGTLLVSLSIIGIYIIVENIYGRSSALIASILYSFSSWRLISLVICYHVCVHIFAIVFSLAFLILGFNKNRRIYFIFSGVAFGAGLLHWAATVLVLPVICLWIIYNWKINKADYKIVLYFLLGVFLIAVIPISMGFMRDFGTPGVYPQYFFLSRADSFSNLIGSHNIKDFLYTLLGQCYRIIYLIYSLLPVPIMLLTLLGLVICIKKRKIAPQTYYLILWIMLCVLVLPFIKSISSHRQESRYILLMLPLPYILSAMSIREISLLLKRKLPNNWIGGKNIALVLLTASVLMWQVAFFYSNYSYGYIKRTGGWEFPLDIEINVVRGSFPGWREAFLLINQLGTESSVIILPPKTSRKYEGFRHTPYYEYYGITFQAYWYTQGKIKSIPYRSVKQVLAENKWDQCFYILAGTEGFDAELKYFQKDNPDLMPIKVIEDVNGNDALFIYMVKIAK